jgi:hypothetical protein
MEVRHLDGRVTPITNIGQGTERMALVFYGHTTCAICNQIIEEGEAIIAFPPLFPNKRDPLYIFHDSASHLNCLQNHQFGANAIARFEQYRAHTGPGHRQCRICGKEITDPDDYFGFGHLTDDDTRPVFAYNFACFHKSCLKDSSTALYLMYELEKLQGSGEWEGPSLPWLIAELNACASV